MTINVRTQCPDPDSVRTKSITNGQIGQLNDRLATKLRESGLLSEDVQKVLMMPGNAVVDEMAAVFRRYVEAQSNIIIRHVRIDRTRTAMAAVNATGRNKYLNDDVVASMPQGEGDESDVYFFKLNRYISDADLDKEYDRRGLKPVDPYALAAVNEEDPAFADDHPNCTHWKDVSGKWCFAAFDRWSGGERSVFVRRFGNGWSGSWFFAGVRK